MITLDEITLYFGDRALFDRISCNIDLQKKIGLVGSNGAGKSTLLKLLAGKQSYDSGSLKTHNARIAYMPQEVVIQSHDDVLTETLKAHKQIAHIQKRLLHIEQQQKNNPDCSVLAQEYAQLHHTLGELDIEAKKTQALIVLEGLGFDEKQRAKKVSELSVGWRMRIVLAQLLLQDADFYLFDEPTNHLDLQTKEWFLQFLQKSQWGYLLISHDTYFLRKATSHTFHISQGTLTTYTGNYDKFLQQYEKNKAHQIQAHEQQERMIAEKMKVINKFRAKPSKAKMAQSMLKELEKIKRIPMPEQEPEIHIKLPKPPNIGRIATEIHNVRFSYSSDPLLQNVSFLVERGEKVAFIAPNGKGKTTLFNILAGKIQPQDGTVTFDDRASIALFDQDQEKVLQPEATIYQEVQQATSTSDQQIRTMLGCLLFSGDSIDKKIHMLSGGERNRVAMAKILLQNANILLLDEPTNHLDVTAKKILLQALQDYKGTIIFVAHDQDFVNKLATRIIEIDGYTTTSYHGNYDTFKAFKEQQSEKNIFSSQQENPSNSYATKKAKPTGKKQHELQKECSKLERKIQKLEQKILSIEEKLGNAEYGSETYNMQVQKHKEAQKELQETLQNWENSMLALEGETV